MAAFPDDGLDPPLAYLRSAAVVYELEDPETQIGRGDHNDISLETKSVSGTHARINIHPHKKIAKLIDLGSTNGTFVDEIRVTDSSAPLKHGSIIRFGYDKEQYTFEFHNMPSPRGVLNEHAPQPPVTSARSHTPAAGKATAHNSPQSSHRAGMSSRSNHSSGVASAMDFGQRSPQRPRREEQQDHRAPGRSASVPPRERPQSAQSSGSASARRGVLGRSLSEQRARLAQRAAAREDASQDLRRTIQEAKRAVAAAAESFDSGRGSAKAGGSGSSGAQADRSSQKSAVRTSHPEEHFARKRERSAPKEIPHSVVFPGASGTAALTASDTHGSPSRDGSVRRVRHAPSPGQHDSEGSDLELSSSFGGIIREAELPSARSSTHGDVPGAMLASSRSQGQDAMLASSRSQGQDAMLASSRSQGQESWAPQAPDTAQHTPGNITIQSFNGNLITSSARDVPEAQHSTTGSAVASAAPSHSHTPPSGAHLPQLLRAHHAPSTSASAPQLVQSQGGLDAGTAMPAVLRASASSTALPGAASAPVNTDQLVDTVASQPLHVPAVSPFVAPGGPSPAPFLAWSGPGAASVTSSQAAQLQATASPPSRDVAALQVALQAANERAEAAEAACAQLSATRRPQPEDRSPHAAAQLTHARLRMAQLESENAQLAAEVGAARDAAAVAQAQLQQAEQAASGASGGMVGEMLGAANEARATADATAQRCSINMLSGIANAWRRRQLARCWRHWAAAALAAQGHLRSQDASEREAVLARELAQVQAQVDALSKTSDWGSEVLRLRRELAATREALARKDVQLARQRTLFAQKSVSRAKAASAATDGGTAGAADDSELDLAVQAAVGGWRYQRAALQAMVQERETQIRTLLQAVAAASAAQPHRKRTSRRSEQRRAAAQVLVDEALASQQAASDAQQRAGGLRALLSRMRREGRAHMHNSHARIARLRRWLLRARRQLQEEHDDDVSLSDESGSDGLGHSSDACSVSSSGSSGSSASRDSGDGQSIPETCFGSLTVSVIDSLGRPGSPSHSASGSSHSSSGGSSSSSGTGSGSSAGGDVPHGNASVPASPADARNEPGMPALFDRLLHSQLRQGASVPTAPPAPAAAFAAGAAAYGQHGSPGVSSQALPHIQSPPNSGHPVFPRLQPPARQPLPPHLAGQLPPSLQGPIRANSVWG